jgi:hypothetical protein
MNTRCILLITALGALLVAAPAAGQPRFATLYTFTDENPIGLAYANGLFYGTDWGLNCGQIFQLQPPSSPGAPWTQTVLYSFVSAYTDACDPVAPPIAGPNGVLYGITSGGGAYNFGAAYELDPPLSSGAPWTETVIYSFYNALGGPPLTGIPTSLALGPNGSLYVTTDSGGAYNNGSLFQLVPPATAGGAWTGTVLYSFTGGTGGSGPNSLTHGPGGVLYGTTAVGGTAAGGGTAFELVPPTTQGGSWTGSIIYTFQAFGDGAGPNGVILGPQGTLYGTTFGRYPYYGENGAGTVFQLTPPSTPGTPWTKTILQSFGWGFDCGPDSPLILRNGDLYGASCQPGGGVVFKMTPPSAPGGAWTTAILHNFSGQTPGGSMVMTKKGTLFGATIIQKPNQPGGTIYALAP